MEGGKAGGERYESRFTEKKKPFHDSRALEIRFYVSRKIGLK